MESTQRRLEKHNAEVYKTAHYTPEQVRHLKEKAGKQAYTIAKFYFRAFPEGLSPSQVHQQIKQYGIMQGDEAMASWERTSIRARITGLTKAGILEQTSETVPSDRGGTEHKWRWKAPGTWKEEPRQMDAFGQPKRRNGVYSGEGA